MKKFIYVSLIALSFCSDTWACISEAPTHNSYMFSVFRRESMKSPFSSAMNDFWKNYADDRLSTDMEYYAWNHDRIDSIARSRVDVKMRRYMKLLDRYLEISSQIAPDSWDYPTKEDLARRQSTLLSILKNATADMSAGMKEQNALLVMRANMLLGYDKENIAFWKSTASALPQGVWRDMARNIYARALFQTGSRLEACNIYAEQGDMLSIKWCMRHYRNLAGIQKIYATDPDSYTLVYLVQDFVNNVQETIDQTGISGADTDDEWFKFIDANAVYKDEAMRFVSFANTVAEEGKTRYPCLWKTAAGMIDYLFGMPEKAVSELDQAMTMEGTPRMKDNARCIRLLASTGAHALDADYSAYLLKEFRWLDTLIESERGSAEDYGNHYTDVKERVVYKALAPKYRAAGQTSTALALLGMMEEYRQAFYTKGRHSQPDYKWEGEYAWNGDYTSWNEYFSALDTLQADVMAGYFEYISSRPSDPFEQYVISQVYPNKDYYNDLTGTRYMAEGRFEEALPYLERVSLDYLAQQNISWYMANRSYTVPRWFTRQWPNLPDTDGPGKGEPKENLKIKYCKDLLKLQSSYNLMREGVQKDEQAYTLATMYYQASCYGDCWFLTHYGHSINDSARSGESDFARKAMEYLRECALSSDPQLRYKSLYALAYVDKDPWYDTQYDKDYNPILILRPASSQYKAMNALYRFTRENPQYADHYTTRCDMLKAFIKATGQQEQEMN